MGNLFSQKRIYILSDSLVYRVARMAFSTSLPFTRHFLEMDSGDVLCWYVHEMVRDASSPGLLCASGSGFLCLSLRCVFHTKILGKDKSWLCSLFSVGFKSREKNMYHVTFAHGSKNWLAIDSADNRLKGEIKQLTLRNVEILLMTWMSQLCGKLKSKEIFALNDV